MNQIELEKLIKIAFAGVTLGGGISLEQSKVQDNGGKDESGRELGENEWLTLPLREVTDDWTAISEETLCDVWSFAHLVEEGFRYYLPAFMVHTLEDGWNSETLSSLLLNLYPKKDQTWEYSMLRYSLLDHLQRSAVAQFLLFLPGFINLDSEDHTLVERALRNYWSDYL
ncbi:MAG: hypothetical protein H7308_12650 [Chthonomonadaceae bacterium]|nr:hypothetical protein [Chthonomonadaceae bacterium]